MSHDEEALEIKKTTQMAIAPKRPKGVHTVQKKLGGNADFSRDRNRNVLQWFSSSLLIAKKVIKLVRANQKVTKTRNR